MAEPLVPDVLINVCQNCVANASSLPRQWTQDGYLVTVRLIPCSGKTDIAYLLRALEQLRIGLCIVACPPGECRLAEGNRRAQVRMQALRRILAEVGLEPSRALLLSHSREATLEELQLTIQRAAKQLCALGPSALHTRPTSARLPP
jgi:coenzyme F420-reducing hydrogenase delta subunit